MPAVALKKPAAGGRKLGTTEKKTDEHTGTEGFLKEMSKHFLDPELADVKIFLGPNKVDFVDAHSIVLCSRSPYFKRCLRSKWVEARTREVDLAAHSPQGVFRALEWMYHGDYGITDKTKWTVPTESKVAMHIRVAEVAQYFDMLPLLDLAKVRFMSILKATTLADAPLLIMNCTPALYGETCVDSIKDEFLKYCRRSVSKPGAEADTAFRSILKQFELYPEFARDLMKEKVPQSKVSTVGRKKK